MEFKLIEKSIEKNALLFWNESAQIGDLFSKARLVFFGV